MTTTATLQVLAEPSRKAILDLLRDGEHPVGDVVATLRQSQPAVSKHLRILREAGLVEARVEGQRRVYRVRPEPLVELDQWLASYRRLWEDVARSLGATARPNEGATVTDGTLQTGGGRPAVRLERVLADPPAVVWRALTEPAESAGWFPMRGDGGRRHVVGRGAAHVPLPSRGDRPDVDG